MIYVISTYWQNLQSELEKTKVKYQELEKQKTDAQGKLDDLDKEVRLGSTTSLGTQTLIKLLKWTIREVFSYSRIHSQAGRWRQFFALLLESQVWRNAEGREAEVWWRNKNSEWFFFTIILYVYT